MLIPTLLNLATPLSILLAVGSAPTPDLTPYTDQEITTKFKAITPKESDFRFASPSGWGENLAKNAPIIEVLPADGGGSVGNVVDGEPSTTWTSRATPPAATFVVDLARDSRFDRIVVFNRQTDQRGTGGGNNAVKRVRLSVASNNSPLEFVQLGEFDLDGPTPVCFKKKQGGQVCAFIDRTEPNVLAVATTNARYIKVEMTAAFWGVDANPEWKTSIALSELMVFDSRTGR